MASWTSRARIGARMASTIATTNTTICSPPPLLESLLRDRRPPPQNVNRRKKSASSAIEPTSTPTISENRMSKLRTWRQLVGHDALELLAIELLEQARRDRHRRVLRVAARRERVGRRVVDEVDLGHRHVRRDRHLLDDVVQLRQGLGIDLLGARHAQHDRVAGVVREQRRDQPEGDRDDERRDGRPRVPGHGPADGQAEHAQQDHHDERRAGPSCACWRRSADRRCRPRTPLRRCGRRTGAWRGRAGVS